MRQQPQARGFVDLHPAPNRKNANENAVMLEAAAICDAIIDLRLYGTGEARNISLLLLDYTIAVVEDDWPALANDQLGEIARDLGSQISEQVLHLTPDTQMQEKLLNSIQNDVELIYDYRISRLVAALAHPPVFVYVVLIGFFVTMACFGAYRPQSPLVVLISIYAAFVGFVMYLILSLSDPFQGAFSVQHALFDVVIEKATESTGHQ